MHGRLDAMARLSAFARRLRAEAEAEGRTVFFWDAGDAADRREKLCRGTKGAAFSAVLNAMGYTLQTMGNDLALPYGPQVMQPVAERANFPILAANFRNGQGPLVAGLSEITLLPLANGITLGVFGLTAPWDGLYKIFGLDVPDTYSTARDMVARLKQAGAAPIIFLSHLGLADDRLVAERVQGIDMIIGAHTHDLLPQGEIHANVLIAQAGQFAEHLGRVDMELDEQGHVIARSAQVLAVPADQEPDPLFLQALEQCEREISELMAESVGVTTMPLDLDYFNECGIGSLAADALRERMNAEIAFVAGGLLHQGLPQGTITRGDLSAACFATANPGATMMRGSQLRAALERGLDPALSNYFHGGFRGSPIGIPQISGMRVEFNPNAPTGSRISRIEIQGEPLDPERLYRVAHTDVEPMGTDDIGYFKLEQGQATESEVPIILGEVMEAYLANHSPVPPPSLGRWKPVT
jgi:2',3'-cyclic-nucleotide 2'-phosphodiesterase (5'-nucleotidase family)